MNDGCPLELSLELYVTPHPPLKMISKLHQSKKAVRATKKSAVFHVSANNSQPNNKRVSDTLKFLFVTFFLQTT